jgi:hypothetical protein
MSEQQNATESILTEKENILLEVLMNPEYRMKSITDICSIAKCDRATYYRAFAKQEFTEAYNSKSKELIKQCVAPVINTFIREAQRGSFQHGKIILEMSGLYVEKQQVTSDNTNHNINYTDNAKRFIANATPDEIRRLNDGEMTGKEEMAIIERK